RARVVAPMQEGASAGGRFLPRVDYADATARCLFAVDAGACRCWRDSRAAYPRLRHTVLRHAALWRSGLSTGLSSAAGLLQSRSRLLRGASRICAELSRLHVAGRLLFGAE